MSEQNKPEDQNKGEKGKQTAGGEKKPEAKAAETPPAPGKGAKAPEKGREARAKTSESSKPAPNEGDRSKTTAKSTETPRTPEKGSGSGLNRGLAIAALLFAIAAAGGAGYIWQELQKTRGSIEATEGATGDRIDQLQSARDRLAGRVESQQDTIEQLRGNLETAEREREALAQAMRHLRTRLSQDRSEWTLAEVEYLLTVANQSLRLQGNVATAVAALQAADQRLVRQADPALIPVRETIAQELQRLRAVPQVDVSGAAARLGGLMASVNDLPLPGESRRFEGGTQGAADSEQSRPEGWSDWRGWLAAVWDELKSLVTIKKADEVGRPLMSPEQQYFLRQNLRLQLETARTALLEEQPEVYRDALNDAGQWASEYFQTEAGTTRAFLQTLDELARMELKPELPDISDSLRTLRRTMDELGRQSGQAAPTAEPAQSGEEAVQ